MGGAGGSQPTEIGKKQAACGAAQIRRKPQAGEGHKK